MNVAIDTMGSCKEQGCTKGIHKYGMCYKHARMFRPASRIETVEKSKYDELQKQFDKLWDDYQTLRFRDVEKENETLKKQNDDLFYRIGMYNSENEMLDKRLEEVKRENYILVRDLQQAKTEVQRLTSKIVADKGLKPFDVWMKRI